MVAFSVAAMLLKALLIPLASVLMPAVAANATSATTNAYSIRSWPLSSSKIPVRIFSFQMIPSTCLFSILSPNERFLTLAEHIRCYVFRNWQANRGHRRKVLPVRRFSFPVHQRTCQHLFTAPDLQSRSVHTSC